MTRLLSCPSLSSLSFLWSLALWTSAVSGFIVYQQKHSAVPAHHHPTSPPRTLLAALDSSSSKEPPSFDPFLRSPHDYPDGTDQPPRPSTSSYAPEDHAGRGRVYIAKEPAENWLIQRGVERGQPEQFFDPLLSPHAYPNGTPDQVITKDQIEEQEWLSDRNDEEYIPQLPTNRVHNNDGNAPRLTLTKLRSSWLESTIPKAISDETSTTDSSSSSPSPSVFDPLRSPHDYPQGTPDQVMTTSRKTKVLGILLIDHGSRNKASNDNLHVLAKTLKQSTYANDETVLVEAAHMELAEPSIPQGIERLLEAGVDEIVCHPFFLSSNGRHVAEDIPAIVEQTQRDLSESQSRVPITITPPVGAQTSLMLTAIQGLVEQNSEILKSKSSV